MRLPVKGRVLHLRSSGGLFGAENVIIEIAKNSHRYGWESIIGGINDVKDGYPAFLDLASVDGIKTVNFECHRRLDLKCVKEIRKFLATYDVNIIHSHGYKENIFTLLMQNSLPKIATNHLWKNVSLRHKLYSYLDAMCIRYFDKVVGVSGEIVKQMERVYVKNLCMIANGVDIHKFKPKAKSHIMMQKFGLAPGDIVIGMVSSLTYEKNHKMAIDAFKKLNAPKAKLLIVGDGKLKEKIHKQVLNSGLEESVIFTGVQNDIVEILSVFDVFLMPSLNEGLPMALLEAMACGKAVIASQVGEIPNVVRHNQNGLLVTPQDLEQLVQAINALVQNLNKIKVLGVEARKTVEEKYSSIMMTKKYCEIYASLSL